MPDVRYMGSSAWSRVVLKNDGKFDKLVAVQPGEVVSVSDEEAQRFASTEIPRHLRVFVVANGPEDKYGDNYKVSRMDISPVSNATAYPELDMGSTVVSNRSITRTADENPEGFSVADSTEGPQSDNSRLVERDEKATKRSSSSSSSTSTGNSGSNASKPSAS